ncbi:MAG: serine/threonine protein kinase [Steroidobacteraceae bacterium]|nr:serine/threonine protein kinase [Steroidobacteraceae bacterium]
MDKHASDDASHWAELQRLFHRCDGLDATAIEAVLANEVADVALRERVRALLRSAESVTPDPAFATPDASAGEAAGFSPVSIGPYRLIEKLGSGGVGTVYLVERVLAETKVRAALKVLAPHAVDASFVERFHREQRLLASLDHPNITRLFDAGTTEDGQPYIVMEYVDGLPIDRYCDERKLDIESRVRLFLTVCDAVSAAHRGLIVHLDLKPSNVLVSKSGIVKLLDFGTSKWTQANGESTATLVATPAFASPEQLLNRPVSTASDVYGLGATLYKLLCGRAPFGNTSGVVRMEKALRGLEPESLARAAAADAPPRGNRAARRAQQELRGDLSTILDACLRNDPRERYGSAEALRDDLERYLSHQPIKARPQTSVYRLRKFIDRHRLALVVAVLVVAVSGASLAEAWVGQARALREADRAVRMQHFMHRLFRMANPDYTAKPVATVAEFLRAGVRNLPAYIQNPADLRTAMLGLAESMYASGDTDDARATLHHVLAMSQGSAAIGNRVEAEIYLAVIDFDRNEVAAGRALSAQAFRLAHAYPVSARVRILTDVYYAFNEDNNGFIKPGNLALLRKSAHEAIADHLPRNDQDLALHDYASDASMQGHVVTATRIFSLLRERYRGDPLALCDRANVDGWLAWIDNQSGHITESLPLFREAYDGYVQCQGPASAQALNEVPYWGDALIRAGRAADAVKLLEGTLPTWRRALGDKSDQVEILYYLSRAYSAVGRYRDAQPLAEEFLKSLRSRLAPGSRMFGLGQMALAEALVGEKCYAAARPYAVRAVRILAKPVRTAYGLHVEHEAQAILRGAATTAAVSPGCPS